MGHGLTTLLESLFYREEFILPSFQASPFQQEANKSLFMQGTARYRSGTKEDGRSLLNSPKNKIRTELPPFIVITCDADCLPQLRNRGPYQRLYCAVQPCSIPTATKTLPSTPIAKTNQIDVNTRPQSVYRFFAPGKNSCF